MADQVIGDLSIKRITANNSTGSDPVRKESFKKTQHLSNSTAYSTRHVNTEIEIDDVIAASNPSLILAVYNSILSSFTVRSGNTVTVWLLGTSYHSHLSSVNFSLATIAADAFSFSGTE